MPAKYHPVAPTLWDRAMRDLPATAKLLRLYVLTCPARVSEGLYQLPIGIAAHDLQLPAREIEQALAALKAAGLVDYDPEAEVVLDRTALKYQPLRNGTGPTGEVKPDKRIAGALGRFEQVPDSPLKAELYRCARRYSPDLADALLSRWPDLTLVEQAPSEPLRQEAPSKPLASPSEGASRAELIRARDEERSSGSVVQCGYCKDPALLEPGSGKVREHDGRPHCGWCEPGDGQAGVA